jgi:hypothetical protein
LRSVLISIWAAFAEFSRLVLDLVVDLNYF